jgi:hypothetical protein
MAPVQGFFSGAGQSSSGKPQSIPSSVALPFATYR